VPLLMKRTAAGAGAIMLASNSETSVYPRDSRSPDGSFFLFLCFAFQSFSVLVFFPPVLQEPLPFASFIAQVFLSRNPLLHTETFLLIVVFRICYAFRVRLVF